MTIDLSQFKQIFLEESDEGLDILESGLLSLDSGTADDDVIHAVFRAAHSIKGGAGTFGLNEIAEFTHIMETLLDEMRDGRRAISQEAINALLSSVDVLREMLEAAAAEKQPSMDRVSEGTKTLEGVLNSNGDNEKTEGPLNVEHKSDVENVPETIIVWEIDFKPLEHLLRTGNDTLRILRELRALGDCNLSVDISAIPDFANFDPELSYFSWHIVLTGEIKEEDINEIFEWVDDDCELLIKRITENQHIEKYQVDNLIAEAEQTTKSENKTEVITTQEKITAESDKETQEPIAVAAKNTKWKSSEGGSIRVGTNKVDALINMVGELVITQSMLGQIGNEFSMERLEDMREGLAQLERNTRELQESVMRIRMLPPASLCSVVSIP